MGARECATGLPGVRRMNAVPSPRSVYTASCPVNVLIYRRGVRSVLSILHRNNFVQEIATEGALDTKEVVSGNKQGIPEPMYDIVVKSVLVITKADP